MHLIPFLLQDIQGFESELAEIAAFIELSGTLYARATNKDKEVIDALIKWYINSKIPSIRPSIRLPIYGMLAEMIDC